MATLIKMKMQRGFGGFPTDRPEKAEKNVILVGIDKTTVKDPEAAMGHLFLPPRGGTKIHYHTKTSAHFYYVIKGRVRWFIGPSSEEFDMEAGDFLYIPRGEIHSTLNLSETEPAEQILCYLGVPSFDFDDTGNVDLGPLMKK